MPKPRSRLEFVLKALLCGTLSAAITVASGQTFPNKPVHMVTAEPGGGTDVVARLRGLAQVPAALYRCQEKFDEMGPVHADINRYVNCMSNWNPGPARWIRMGIRVLKLPAGRVLGRIETNLM